MVLNLWVLGDRVLSWFLDMLQDYDALGSGWSGIVNGILFAAIGIPLAISQGIVVVEVAVGLSMGVEHVVLIMEEAMVMVGEEGGYGMENRGVEYN
ncbi:hypothetical protein V6N11_001155 [Hibiscus sabdariffa]|uniref:Uncharacterized protein n=1 Tax=Hibiscus sabdariffa TaxID=183260 RepID=A0ABR2RYW6_9ROSI